MNSSSIGPFPAQFAYATSTTASVDAARNAGRDVKSSSTDQMAATQELMETYDFTNMTPRELAAAANELYRSGSLTLEQSGTLATMAGLAGLNPPVPKPGAADRPMNFHSMASGALEHARSIGDSAQVRHWEGLVAAIERLQNRPWRVDVSA